MLEKALTSRRFGSYTLQAAIAAAHAQAQSAAATDWRRIVARYDQFYEFSAGDHIKPWREGGKTNADNWQMLCKDDNLPVLMIQGCSEEGILTIAREKAT